jgi:hypothetical protein
MKELTMTTTTGTPRQSRQAHPEPTSHDGRRGRVVVGLVLAGFAAAAVVGGGAAAHRSGQVATQNPASTRTVPAAQTGSRAGGKHVTTTHRAAAGSATPGTLIVSKVPDAGQRLQARYGARGTS